ncbi:glycoside hydrolase family 19 protein [Alysiella crassa]|uniref:Predicted chitinase n=2 Tax=Alysiella crassa TaxID=153491 RepID=A0A376BV37_9NEIS|nr:glycoside hydrolase family 19 protein [Alysiella crassa]SSY80655.1 Predicted chitinase [Alysiella crassa]
MSEIIPIPDNAVSIEEHAQNSVAQTLANAAFFNIVRPKLFSGSLNQSQVDGINALVLAGVEHGLTLQQHAYVLATALHETAYTMQPIREYGRGQNYAYGRWQTNSHGVKYCYKNGSRDVVYTENECPHLFYGRGFVQLTWYDNYRRAGDKLGVDLLNNPDLALQTNISAKIIVLGMKEGWFTGKKLSDYINDHRDDYVNARRIVNGMDKAEQIARYARVFEMALNLI